ncbi:hypothetical protein CE143_21345 [Photorhabdus luminescens]|nr:hypothetical protein CE143_21345 [Photorhabdus luminescens]
MPMLLSNTQERFFYEWKLTPNSPAFNTPLVFKIQGNINVSALNSALASVVKRHNTLRTVFIEVNDKVFQKILDDLVPEMELVDLTDIPSYKQNEVKIDTINKIISKPFDLTKAPLFKFCLIKLSSEKFYLVFNLHHIITDGYSANFILQDLSFHYNQFIIKNSVILPNINISINDYLDYEENLINKSEGFKEGIKFWLSELKGAELLINLYDKTAEETTYDFNGKRYYFDISDELTHRIKIISKKVGVTTFILLTGLFSILIRYYTGQDNITLGYTKSNRNKMFSNLFACLLNQLPMRIKLNGDLTFSQLLERIKKNRKNARQYENVPTNIILRSLRKQENASILRLYNVSILRTNFVTSGINFTNACSESILIDTKTSKDDLTFIYDEGDSLQFAFEYKTALFSDEYIIEMAHSFTTLLENMLKNPDSKIRNMQILEDQRLKEKIQINIEPRIDRLPNLTIYDLFNKQVSLVPNHVAIETSHIKLTYAELNQEINSLTNFLKEKLIKSNINKKLIGLCFDRNYYMVVSILTALRLGIGYLPLDPGYPEERLKYISQDADLELILTNTNVFNNNNSLKSINCDLICVDSIESQVKNAVINYPISPDDLAYVIYTSGSTGKPKGVKISQTNIISFVLSAIIEFNFQKEDSFLGITSWSFDIFLLEILLPLLTGGKYILYDQSDKNDFKKISEFIKQKKPTFVQATPTFWESILTFLTGYKNKIKILCGGEPLTTSVKNGLLNISPNVWNVYGPTETTIWSTVYKLSNDKAIKIGYPFNNTELYVLNKDLNLLPTGVIGELYIGGLGVGQGYLNQGILTKKHFLQNPFSNYSNKLSPIIYKTGDLVKSGKNGVLEYISRCDSQVKVRGHRIELGEIEKAIELEEKIAKAIVVVVDTNNGKQLFAYYITKNKNIVDPTIIRQKVQLHLPYYMVPTHFIALQQFPTLPSGKIDRKKISILKPQSGIVEKYDEESFTETEKQIANIWKNILDISSLTHEQTFFELGGDSITATKVIYRIEDYLKITLSIRSIFEHSTIKSLSEFIDNNIIKNTHAISIKPIPSHIKLLSLKSPLSDAQKRLWFLYKLNKQSPVYNISEAFMLNGEVNVIAIKYALEQLTKRHETLQGRFIDTDGVTIQQYDKDPHLNFQVIDLSTSENLKRESISDIISNESNKYFKLEEESPFRALLISIKKKKHILVVSLHHIISDGWSMGILLKEFAILYKNYVVQDSGTLPPLKYKFSDYVVWRNERLNSSYIKEGINYWKKRLEGSPALLSLPTDYPRPPIFSHQGKRASLSISKQLSDRLNLLCNEHNVTLFMLLLAALKTLLFRYTGQKDIVVGTLVANRSHPDFEDIVGFFVNTLAIRTELDEKFTFHETLNIIKNNTLKDFSNQEVPFESIIEAINPTRSLSYTPLFQVLFVLQNTLPRNIDLSPLKIELIDPQLNVAKYDLTLSLNPTIQGLRGYIEYSTDLFTEESIINIIDNYKNLLEKLTQNIDEKLSSIDFICSKQKNNILTEYSGSNKKYNLKKDIIQRFEEQATQYPNNTAIIDNKAHTSIDYQTLTKEVEILARYLQSLGIKKQDKVAICLQRSESQIKIILAVLKIGAICVPIDNAMPKSRILSILHDVTPAILISKHIGEIESYDYSNIQCCQVAELLHSAFNLNISNSYIERNNNFNTTDLAYIIYTSGSTGEPKGVGITRGCLSNLIDYHIADLKQDTPISTLYYSPLTFDVSFQELFSTLSCGGTLHIIHEDQRSDFRWLSSYIDNKKIERIFLPYVALNILSETATSINIFPKQLKHVITAGEKLVVTPSIRTFFSKLPGANLHNHYGPAETHVVTEFILTGQPETWPDSPPIGKPIRNAEIYILDSNLQPLPIGGIGEIFIGGIPVSPGYINKVDETVARFLFNPYSNDAFNLYRTGDMGYWRFDGNIQYIGRQDYQIKNRGFRIELGEIESVLDKSKYIKKAAVINKPLGQEKVRIVAFCIVNETNLSSENYIEIIFNDLKESLPDYMLPAKIFIVKELPITANGKVNRKKLLSVKEENEVKKVNNKNLNEYERKVFLIWQEVLGHDKFIITDNFFDVGGNSLAMVRVQNALSKEFNKEINLIEMFKYTTVSSISKYLNTPHIETNKNQSIASEKLILRKQFLLRKQNNKS